MEKDINTEFLLAWLPYFAADPPTQKECEVPQMQVQIDDLQWFTIISVCLTPTSPKEVLQDVAVSWKLVDAEPKSFKLEDTHCAL